MLNAFVMLLIFTLKAIIIVALALILVVGVIALSSTKGKEKIRGRIQIKNLNKKYDDIQETLMQEILTKDDFKKFVKQQKIIAKENIKLAKDHQRLERRVFVLNFCGDIKASAVTALREEVSAVLGVATINDEVVVRLESAGGMVHAYGLAAAQLARLRQKRIPLTITVDKVAASGGYLMASVADKILAAPFAIIGSIGVVVQMPNFHRYLEQKQIDFEQLTAGDYKRTLTLFGQNTEEDRAKMQTEIDEIHQLFMAAILQYRPDLDMHKVATGEHWLALQAAEMNLVDEIRTSDDYLSVQSDGAKLYEIVYEVKKPWISKIGAAANLLLQREDYSRVLLK
jgi:serine protease SohB